MINQKNDSEQNLEEKEELAPVNPSGEKIGEEISLEEVLSYLKDKSFLLKSPLIWLVGGLVTQGKTEGDIDILINFPENIPKEIKIPLEFRILRCLPEKLRERVSIMYNEYSSPFTDHIELADLKVEAREEPKKVEMGLDKKSGNELPSIQKKSSVDLEENIMNSLEQFFKDGEITLIGEESVKKTISFEEGHFIVLKVNKAINLLKTWSYELGLSYSDEDKIPEKYIWELEDKKYHWIGKSYNTDVKAEAGDILTITFNSLNRYFDSETGEERLYIYEPVVKESWKESTEPDSVQALIKIGQESGILVNKEPVKNLDLIYPVSDDRFDNELQKGFVEVDEIPEGISEGRFVWFATEVKDENS